MSWMARLREQFFGVADWDDSKITDEWFRAHFGYAADVVHQWLEGHVDFHEAKILNFGCGDGITDLALVLRHGATSIHGVDIRQEYKKLGRIAQEQLGMPRLPSALTFETISPGAALATSHANMDALVSWSTFEHVQRDQLLPIMQDLRNCLRPGGVFFLQIEPLFYSPFGSHLRRYDDVPWHHLLASEAELWKVIQAHDGPIDGAEVDFGFEDFGAEGYKKFVFHEYQMLNRLTADELVGIARDAGFSVLREERRHVDLEVPSVLLENFEVDCLKNNELLLLLGRP